MFLFISITFHANTCHSAKYIIKLHNYAQIRMTSQNTISVRFSQTFPLFRFISGYVYTRSGLRHTPSHWFRWWIVDRTQNGGVLTPFVKSSFEPYKITLHTITGLKYIVLIEKQFHNSFINEQITGLIRRNVEKFLTREIVN